ncbi:TPA: hypothetical protein KFM62_005105 [Escherichia coli]|jgi:hypothetical protein|uniref:hypothetical protein n=1 Tax=Citrobacter freundii TaxID=546 RepID=UPI001B9A8830|nr:hypothetical protein [Escherichia coli]HBC9557785.1 hypothetical protein [Escherichia coli]
MTGIKHETGGSEVEFGVVDNEGQIIDGVAYGNQIEKFDGGVVVTRPDGSKITMFDDGGMNLEHFTPKSIGINSLSEVIGYSIERTDTYCTHKIELINDGYAEITYSPLGEFLEMSGSKIKNTINKENELYICAIAK